MLQNAGVNVPNWETVESPKKKVLSSSYRNELRSQIYAVLKKAKRPMDVHEIKEKMGFPGKWQTIHGILSNWGFEPRSPIKRDGGECPSVYSLK